MIPEVCKIGKILYLNSVSESEKLQKSVSQKMEQWFYRKFHFEVFKYKVVAYDYSFRVETTTIHFLVPKSTYRSTKSMLFEALLVSARKTSNTKL